MKKIDIKSKGLKFTIFQVASYFILLLPLGLTSCSPSGDTSTTLEATFTSLYNNVLSKNCVGCHQPGGSGFNAGALIDFSTHATSYSTLINRSTSGDTAVLNGQCSNVPLVLSGQPSSSYLLATLFTDYNHSDFYKTGCTPYSPSGHGATVGTSEKDAFVQWIQGGALDN